MCCTTECGRGRKAAVHPAPFALAAFTPRHSQKRLFEAFRCFAAAFAHEMALPSSICTEPAPYASVKPSPHKSTGELMYTQDIVLDN